MEAPIEDRPLLVNIAYRMLGSVSEAEDAVQEASTRWYALSGEEQRHISSPTGWLVTVTTRICLDVLGSARARRERYVGEWLPEPVPELARWTSHTGAGRVADPADRVSLDESLSMALLVVLEAMTPAERVSFTLHDVFGYSFAEIGEIVGRSEEASRRLASSARRRVRDSRRARVDIREHERVVALFKAAVETGDLRALVEVLDPNATVIPDGGGLVAAATAPVTGAEEIARYLVDLRANVPGLAFEMTTVNGQPGLISRESAERPSAVMAVEVVGGRVARIWAIRNPQKLTGWT
ncbi:RNA polymerase sigma factor SigJ [Pseudactinotalea sp.]|uniref:RNA polymerase sigma factor SigJ n=1 Tax=Pseudactinotalea sp. TaxID=1926260 RepID=UPI003B3BA9C0